MYCLIKTKFPINNPFYKLYTHPKYEDICIAIDKVFGIKYSTFAMRMYFYRIRNGTLKDYARINKKYRWNHFAEQINSFIDQNSSLLSKMLRNPEEIGSVESTILKDCPEENKTYVPKQVFDTINFEKKFDTLRGSFRRSGKYSEMMT